MSAFGNKLNELMVKKNVNGHTLATTIGKSEAHISKLRTGKQAWVSPDDLASIGEALQASKREKAELLYSHLLDECEGEGSEWIEITLRGYRPPDPSDLTSIIRRRHATPAKLLNAIDALHQAALDDPDMADHLEGLARILGLTEVPPTKAPGELLKYPPIRENLSSLNETPERDDSEVEKPLPMHLKKRADGKKNSLQ